MSIEQANYAKIEEMFPDVIGGKYSYMRLESKGFEPLSLEWTDENRICMMHTYELNGDLCYDPMMEFEVNPANRTLTAVSFEQSIPPLYQMRQDNGEWLSVDGNGIEHTYNVIFGEKVNKFAAQWFDNISEQGFMPVRGTMEIDGDDLRVEFDKSGSPIIPKLEKEYDLGYGFLGNGITVWNRAEERGGDYVTVAHIENDGTVTFYDKDIPDAVKAKIEKSTWLAEVNAIDRSLPDPTVTAAEMQKYGYTADDMLPLSSNKAIELFDTGHPVFLLYPDNTEAMAFSRDEIITFDGLCGITRDDWEISSVYKAQIKAEESNENSRESDLLYGDGNTFGVYQIHDGNEFRNYRFASMKDLEAEGLTVNRANYELVYTAPFLERMEFLTDSYSVLNKIYEDFNITHPANFTGHSLSVSDIIVLKYNGEIASHYVDSVGFVEIGAFLGEETPKSHTVETSVQDTELSKSEIYSQVGNTFQNDRSAVPESKSTLMERLEANKIKAAQQGHPTNRAINREV
ncbi:MAG: YodL domain-containing protein [Oscillospiraceae bacterium]|nr:YodL domain-containing protein [Oscillospiraceae bacterium]